MNKCFYCDQSGVLTEGTHQVGVSLYNKSDKKLAGFVCEDHIETGLNELAGQCFATKYWPIVADLDGTVLYHSYDADKAGFAIAAGWAFRKEF
ncbi:MAG: hypothetical protein AAF731_07720 [Bacteroidota bacterium]